jgi:hypothetical protein
VLYHSSSKNKFFRCKIGKKKSANSKIGFCCLPANFFLGRDSSKYHSIHNEPNEPQLNAQKQKKKRKIVEKNTDKEGEKQKRRRKNQKNHQKNQTHKTNPRKRRSPD